jgi:hypothetical protein
MYGLGTTWALMAKNNYFVRISHTSLALKLLVCLALNSITGKAFRPLGCQKGIWGVCISANERDDKQLDSLEKTQ